MLQNIGKFSMTSKQTLNRKVDQLQPSENCDNSSNYASRSIVTHLVLIKTKYTAELEINIWEIRYILLILAFIWAIMEAALLKRTILLLISITRANAFTNE